MEINGMEINGINGINGNRKCIFSCYIFNVHDEQMNIQSQQERC